MWSSSNTAANSVSSVEEYLFVLSHTPDASTLSTTVPVLIDVELDTIVSDDTSATVTATFSALSNPMNPGIFALPLDSINGNLTMATARTSPVGFMDFRIDSGNLVPVLTALVRVN